MTTILVDIPETLYRFGGPSAHYNLLSPFGGSAQHHFLASEILQLGDSEVFRGTIRREEGKENVVICKLVKGKLARLKREAAFYRQQLRPLQGRFVPQYYGYYEGTVSEEDEDVPVACILLQDCGRPITHEALMNDETK